jgi:hypothetical protein
MYLVVAQGLWPVYAPFAAWLMEPDARRRRVMLACLAVGLGVGGHLLATSLSAPSGATIVNTCIVYRTPGSHPLLTGLAYLAATGLPLVASSRRAIVALGVITLLGSVVAYVFYWEAFLSVWCFFAAAASVVILGHFEWPVRALRAQH